ncbi:sensor histidine kinase [Paenibacillus chungangensis]|uniref:Sensor histidine kinase n=1 Tax=Paenibacillus chungangensis TaxID=696535 RepID=A0ABW3HRD0_9BACL
MVKYKIFRNLLVFFIASLLIISFLFTFADRNSKEVMRQTLQSTSLKQLEFAVNEMESTLKQLEILAVLLSDDSSIQAYGTANTFAPYLDSLLLRKTIEEKLLTQSFAYLTQTKISVYWPERDEIISSTNEGVDRTYHPRSWESLPKYQWFFSDTDGLELRYILVEPYSLHHKLENVSYSIETSLTVDFLKQVLRSVEATGNGKAFFSHPSYGFIDLNNKYQPLYNAIQEQVGSTMSSHQTLRVGHDQYLVQRVTSSLLGWQLVQYIPVEDFFAPLDMTRWITKLSLIIILLLGSLILVMLYRNVKRPIAYLVRKIEGLAGGKYESRVHWKVNNEFDYLFDRFNEMASRIQILIEDVYEERLRTQEAVYKQLQSQINPHFLYNSLFYVVGMAKKNPQAVIEMAQNLAYYYRFITKNNFYQMTLEEELKLVKSYLSVQALRNTRLSYRIEVDEGMQSVLVPPLILQPIVENAIIHGIDNKADSGMISIRGSIQEEIYMLVVEDDGYGMPADQLASLHMLLDGKQTMHDKGCGLWNVHQRLRHRYGPLSGLTIESSDLGGISITIRWLPHEEKGNCDEYAAGG